MSCSSCVFGTRVHGRWRTCVHKFVFVPNAENAPEGEGWLLGYVINTRSDTTELRILNAQAIADGPVACIHIPHRIPPGFHGNWIADN